MFSPINQRPAVIVSACLTGVRCRYDGGHRLDENVLRLSAEVELVPFCPEVEGRLSTPRVPSEIVGGDGDDVIEGTAKIIDAEGRDVTSQFLKGSNEGLSTARRNKIIKAIMKEKSPSCGVHNVYRDGTIVNGRGVFTAILLREGIEVISNEEI